MEAAGYLDILNLNQNQTSPVCAEQLLSTYVVEACGSTKLLSGLVPKEELFGGKVGNYVGFDS